MEPGRGANERFDSILPRNTTLLTGNRTGQPIHALTPSSSWRQCFNHFSTNGETFGWGDCSSQTQILLNMSTQWTGQKRLLAARGLPWGKVAVDSATGFPRNMPDWIMHDAFTPSNTWPNGIQSVVAIATGFSGAYSGGDIDIEEHSPTGAIIAYGVPNGSTAALVGVNEIVPNGRLMVWTSAEQNLDSANKALAISMQGVSSPDRNVGVIMPLVTQNTPRALSVGPNMICLFGSMVPSTYPPSRIVNCSQPLSAAALWKEGAAPYVPPDKMAVFVFSNATANFEVGVRSDGYFMIGGNQVVNLDTDEYDINFSTITNLQTPLVPPRAHGNRMARTRRF